MSRLFEQYNSEIKKSMQEKFQYGNVMEIPKLEKIVINIGVGDAVGNAKASDVYKRQYVTSAVSAQLHLMAVVTTLWVLKNSSSSLKSNMIR